MVLLHTEDDLGPALKLGDHGGATRVQTEVLLGDALKIRNKDVYGTGLT